MPLVYPNIVPENNLRLPDAVTIKHGPARLLAPYLLESDKAARRLGIALRVRHEIASVRRACRPGGGPWRGAGPRSEILRHLDW